MSSPAVINGLGRAIKLDSSIIDPAYSGDGFLFSFTVLENNVPVKYRLFKNSEFKKSHQIYKTARSGYYKLESFIQYRRGALNLVDLYNAYRYDNFIQAEVGDIVTVSRLSPGYTSTDSSTGFMFDNFYINLEYLFKVRIGGMFYNKISDFPQVITDVNDPSYSLDINSPLYSEILFSPVGFNNTAAGFFYAINFGNHVANWTQIPNLINDDDELVRKEQSSISATDSDISKSKLAILMTNIAWRTTAIVKDVLPTIAIDTLDNIAEYYMHYLWDDLDPSCTFIDSTKVYNYTQLDDADKIVAEVLRSWGYITKRGYQNYLNSEAPLIPFDPVVSTIIPSLKEYSDYYNAIYNLYNTLFICSEDDEGWLFPSSYMNAPPPPPGMDYVYPSLRVTKLIFLLPYSAIFALPKVARLILLDNFVRGAAIEETFERKVLELVSSFANEIDADALLDYLLISPSYASDDKTRFEILYIKMDDARLERYPPISLFVEQRNNRMHFIFALYKIWSLSKYNFYHIPTGTPPIDGNINPNAFWLTPNGLKYFIQYDSSGSIIKQTNLILEFGGITTSISRYINNSPYGSKRMTISFEPYLDNLLVKVDKVETTYEIATAAYSNSAGPPPMVKNTEYESYHLFQPIILINYISDIDFGFKIPEQATVPAFLFYYAQDFRTIKEFDAKLLFTIEVGVEIGFFFASGGTSIISNLRHLKSIYNINKIRTAYTLAMEGEAIFLWKGAEAGYQVVTVTGGLLHSYFYYESTIAANNNLRQLNEKLSFFFFLITLTGIGGSIYSNRRLVRSADNIMIELAGLQVPHNLPTKILDLITEVRGAIPVMKATFYNTVNTFTDIQLGEVNNMVARINIFNDAKRTAFYEHFYHYENDIDFWIIMNETRIQIDSVLGSVSRPAARLYEWEAGLTKYAPLASNRYYLDNIIDAFYRDWWGIDHLKYPGNRRRPGKTDDNWTGGHVVPISARLADGNNLSAEIMYLEIDGINDVKILKSSALNLMDSNTTSPRIIEYLEQTNPENIYTTFKVHGHILHENMFIIYPNAPMLNNSLKFNGKVVTHKPFITEFNPSWTETDLKFNIAYALANKRYIKSRDVRPSGLIPTDPDFQTPFQMDRYVSEMADGTKVLIDIVPYYKYGTTGPKLINHMTYFDIDFKHYKNRQQP